MVWGWGDRKRYKNPRADASMKEIELPRSQPEVPKRARDGRNWG